MSEVDRLLESVWMARSLDGGLDVDRVVDDVVRREMPLESSAARTAMQRELIAHMSGLGPLHAVADDPSVTEIMVNHGSEVWVERSGRLERASVAIDADQTEELVRRLAARVGRRIDRSSPSVDVRLPDGARLHAIFAPLAVDGPCVTIRRFSARPISLGDLAAPAAVRLLRRAVESRATVLIAGATSSGKTTLLNALCGVLDPAERVVTIEDSAELRLPGEHVVRLETRLATEHVDAVGVKELVRESLRMRPDRIICGEMRGGEALDLVQALNTGHRGSLTTVHANSAPDALRRVETMMLLGDGDLPLAAIREQLAACIDLVVMTERGADGRRFVAAVDEVPEHFVDRWQTRELFGAGAAESPRRRWAQ